MAQKDQQEQDLIKSEGRSGILSKGGLWICVGLIAATAGVYWPMLRQDFVEYDDTSYVVNDKHIQNGLNRQSVEWSFTTFRQANWHPLTWLSLIADYQLFNGKAWGFKLTNLVLHGINTLLLFYLLWRMTGALWCSGFAAALFLLHPLHVESVAWVSERKDVLSTMFWMLTMICYVRFTHRLSARWYIGSVVCMAMGLLAKPMLVTLPFVLLLIDIWPLERRRKAVIHQKRRQRQTVSIHIPQKTFTGLVIEKFPFFALTIASCVVTFIAQQHGGSVATLESFSPEVRIQNAVIGYVRYLAKMVWPTGLTVFYPHYGAMISGLTVFLCAFVMIAITVLVFWRGRRRWYFPFGWLWFLGTLVPVIGLVQVGSQSIADRYTYIPLIGPFVMLTWWGEQWLSANRRIRWIGITASIGILILLGGMTMHQLSFWKNTMTLAERSVKVAPKAYVGHSLLGIEYNRQGQYDLAIQSLTRSLELRPSNPTAHLNMGIACFRLKQYRKALDHLEQAVRLGEDSTAVYYHLGHLFAMFGKHSQACEMFRKAIQKDPENSGFHHELALSLAQSGHLSEAIQEFEIALKYDKQKNDPSLYNNVGHAWLIQGQYTKAIPYFKQALLIDPMFELSHLNLNKALIKTGRSDEALRRAQQFAARNPDNPDAIFVLGATLGQVGRLAEAEQAFEKVLQLKPDHPQAKRELNILRRELHKSK